MSRLAASSRIAWVEGPNARSSASRIRRFEFSEEVELRVRRDEVIDEPDGDAPCGQPDLLLPVPVDHVVAPGRARSSGLSPVDLRAGLSLQLDRDVLGDVPGPRAFDQPFAEPSGVPARAGMLAHAREDREQFVGETVDRVRRPVLEGAQIDEQLDRRLVGVVVGPSVDLRMDDREIRAERWCFGLHELSRALGLFGGAHSEASRSILTPPSSEASSRARRSKT